MAEDSFLWTTGGAGDGSATYTRADWARIAEVLAACSKFEGVAPAYRNELEATDGGANTVDVDTGGAVVDGKPYENSSSVGVNIPSAVGGGNTRIDRIVLRADWTAQTVRITRIAGTDAASPTAPAITQTSGSTYDIMICQVLVDISGNVTVTDERDWANAPEVPQFIGRQGGDSADWSVAGSTDYTPTAVRMQAGVRAFNLTPVVSKNDSVSITFPEPFSDVPIMLVSALFVSGSIVPDDGELAAAYVTSLSSSGATIGITINYTAVSEVWDVHWLAIGPK